MWANDESVKGDEAVVAEWKIVEALPRIRARLHPVLAKLTLMAAPVL